MARALSVAPAPRRVAVVGAGWAGLAAAVDLCDAGSRVTLLEMATQAGGRARAVEHRGLQLDNGQHIMIGAYRATLDLMARLGIDTSIVLARLPLTLRYPDGRGLRLPPGPAWLAFALGVATAKGWRWSERAALLLTTSRWAARGFRCAPDQTVSTLCTGLPAQVQADLIEPLCVAALNTPANQANAAVLLRVLKDALFGGPGGADLLLPRTTLDRLLPLPALAWLRDAGASIELGRRVQSIERDGSGWRVDGEPFDQVLLACTAVETARLVRPLNPSWSMTAEKLQFEPIITVWLESPGASLPMPMLALPCGADAPAQFVFDQGALGGASGRLAAVVSAAGPWLDRGLLATAEAVRRQLERDFTGLPWAGNLQVVGTVADRRATFRCVPGLARPDMRVATNLLAAGDYVHGPYPSTLEGAVRSGQAAAAQLSQD